MLKENNEYDHSKQFTELPIEESLPLEQSTPTDSSFNKINQNAKWIDNQGNEVEEVFGFNENAELVNGRAAMFGFFMLILTEIVFGGTPATKSIFGIG